MKTKFENKPARTNSIRIRLQGSTLAIVLFVVFAIVASTHGIELSTCPSNGTIGTGYLVVYSATDRVDDGDTPYYPHSSYVIYTAEGKFFKTVANHVSASDEVPDRVMLPVGRYLISARSEEKGYTRADIIVRSGRTTIVNLESSTLAGQ
jgi:hypothetical protein